MKKKNQRLKERFEKILYDETNPDACEKNMLATYEIPELSPEESQKYGNFKIERKWKVKKYGTKVIEKSDAEHLYVFVNNEYLHNEWHSVRSHTIYEWAFDVDHGKESEKSWKPLIPVMYIDIEYGFYYLENQEGILYFSTDKYNWFWHCTGPENRAYHNRIEKLRKFNIPYTVISKQP